MDFLKSRKIIHLLMNLSAQDKFQKKMLKTILEKMLLLRALGTEVVVNMDIKTIMFEEGDFLFFVRMDYPIKYHETKWY